MFAHKSKHILLVIERRGKSTVALSPGFLIGNYYLHSDTYSTVPKWVKSLLLIYLEIYHKSVFFQLYSLLDFSMYFFQHALMSELSTLK